MFKKRNSFIVALLFLIVCISCNDRNETIVNRIKDLQLKSSQSESLDSSYVFLKEAQNLIHSSTFISDSLKAENNFLLGKNFRPSGQLDSAAIYYHKAADYVTDSIKSQHEINYFFATWSAYLDQNKFGDCLAISEKYRSLLGDNYELGFLNYNYMQDQFYDKIENYEQALKYNKNLIENYKTLGYSAYSALISQAKYKYYLEDKEGALRILDSLSEIANTIPHINRRQLYIDKGVYANLDKDYNGAFQNYSKALSSIKELPENQTTSKNKELARTYINLSNVFISLKKYKKAETYLDSVSYIGFNNMSSELQRKALKTQLHLSFLTRTDISKVNMSLDTIYDFQLKEYENKYENELTALANSNRIRQQILNEKNSLEISNFKRTIILLSVIAFIIIISVFVYKQRQYRFEKQSLQMQQRLLRAQMNPHFTFNALSTIQNYVKKDQNKATSYLLKFSRLLRLILENSMQNYVLLSEELELLREYMDLQLLRFPSKFTYNIVINDFEVDDLLFIPPMLLQPFIENSIEHGFLGIDYIGDIKLMLTKKDKYLECTIEDNGVGLKSISNLSKASASTSLIKDFLKKATKSEIEIINKSNINKNQSGVITKLLIPIKLTEND